MKCFIVAALMTLSIANAAVILQPGQYPFAQYPAGAARVYYSDPPVQFTGPRAVYRASNLGVAHEAELLGFNEPVFINNLLPASLAQSEPVLSLPSPVVVRQPSEVFGAQAPAPELPVTTYEASNAGVTHKAELVGFSHPVVISNLDSAPAAPAAPETSSEPAAAAEQPAEPARALPVEQPAEQAEPAQPAEQAEPAQAAAELNLPVTTYEASNAGVTHKAELVGYSHPVVISNLDSAPAAVVQEPLAQPQPAFYRALNLGIVHEAPLVGHTKSIIAENLEPAAGTPPASTVFVTLPAQPSYRWY